MLNFLEKLKKLLQSRKKKQITPFWKNLLNFDEDAEEYVVISESFDDRLLDEAMKFDRRRLRRGVHNSYIA